jgi:hypothetical protein
MWLEDVGKKRLVHPGTSNRAARITDNGVENLEAAPSRGRQPSALDLAQDSGPAAGSQRDDRLHAATVLVAERQAIEQVFDCQQAGSCEIGGLPRTYTSEKLERCGEKGFRAHLLLHDDRLPRTDIDLPNTGWKLEGIV